MKKYLNYLLIGAASIGGVWAIAFHGITFLSVFAPKLEEVRRNTYVQSESYVRGVVLDLRKQQAEYLKEKDPATRTALASLMRDTASGIPQNLLPSDLLSFLQSLQPTQQ